KRGYRLLFGGTDNHMLLIDVTQKGASGKEAEAALDKAAITVNKNMIPDDARSPMDPSGIRLGTPAITTRGMKETEMRQIADWIDRAIAGKNDDETLSLIRSEVLALTSRFPLYKDLSYSNDQAD
ncbi:MAG: serine hydroxymethyltransferase, partial [Patescibacteria group bacterium]